MLLNSQTIKLASYIGVGLGVLIGALGFVRSGSLLIALGTAGIASEKRNQRSLEFYLPMAIAIALFTLAIALPHGR
jgi:NAD/NADP transhydrogenase beta subunit